MEIIIEAIYYGVLPPKYIDIVKNYNKDTQIALDLQTNEIEVIVERILAGEYGKILHSFNPQILSYMTDEVAVNYLHYVNSKGEFKKLGSNPDFIRKLVFMTPGEVVSDSKEFWGEYN
jgi:hypothetical protein